MNAATIPVQRPHDAKLLVIDAHGRFEHSARSHLADFLRAGDLLVANDAATLPASLVGVHERSGETIEVRLAGRRSLAINDVHEFSAIVFGPGDHRTRTEDRAAPPALRAGDHLLLGPLQATVLRLLDHPRLITLRFEGAADRIRAGIARHGRPIQYAHLGRVDRGGRAARGLRATVGRLRARLALAGCAASTRYRLRDADTRRRHLVHRRCGARRAAAVRRTLRAAGDDR
jgi:S-adenosylmethionine:tRNA-ribosyltransferase-isomerase (queuine synthetase)